MYTYPEAENWANLQRCTGHQIAQISGCFTLLHPAHIELFEETRKQIVSFISNSSKLKVVVTINCDLIIKALKSNIHIPFPAKDRIYMLESLRTVDKAFIFYEPDPGIIAQAIMPNFYIKGYDWAGKHLPELDNISPKPQVIIVETAKHYSSSFIIHSLTESNF